MTEPTLENIEVNSQTGGSRLSESSENHDTVPCKSVTDEHFLRTLKESAMSVIDGKQPNLDPITREVLVSKGDVKNGTLEDSKVEEKLRDIEPSHHIEKGLQDESPKKKDDGKQGAKRTNDALSTDLPPLKKLASDNCVAIETSTPSLTEEKVKEDKGKVFDFKFMRAELLKELEVSFLTGDIDNIKKKYTSFVTTEGDKRASFDHAFRDKLYSLLKNDPNDVIGFEKLVVLSMNLCKHDLLSPVFPVLLLSDIFDTTTIATCEKLFDYVEKNVKTWKEPSFFTLCKNSILRMCNDLLRRLSKTHNTIFCGRILMFLAMFFPFSERSGLNIVSEFNVDSVVKYEDKPLESCEDLSDSIAHDLMLKVNDGFHSKFWSLQKFFRSPVLCYSPSHWKEFVAHTNEILSIFHNYKLDPTSAPSSFENDQFFTNFLTNKKLLVHQLSDAQFRRTIYLQFLFLFQFLTAHVKSKQESQELKSEQTEWVKDTTDLLHTLIKETPPDGEQFLACVRFVLEREELWNKWKNDGCPAPTKLEQEATTLSTSRVLKHKRELGDAARDARKSKRICVPYNGIEREYVIEEKYDEASRNLLCVPNTDEFFEEAIMHLDPAAQIEPQYRKTNDIKFCWMALKLLAMRSEYFFTVQPIPIPSMNEYVEIILKRIHRDKNPGLLLPPLMAPPKAKRPKSPVKPPLSTKSKVLLAQEKIQAAIARAKSRPKLPETPKEDLLVSDSSVQETRISIEAKPNPKSHTTESKSKSTSSSKPSQKTKSKDDHLPKSKDDSVIKSKPSKETENVKSRSQTPSPAIRSESSEKKSKIESLPVKPKTPAAKSGAEPSKAKPEPVKAKLDSSKSKPESVSNSTSCPPSSKGDGNLIKSKNEKNTSSSQKQASGEVLKSPALPKQRNSEGAATKQKSESISLKQSAPLKSKTDSTASKPKTENGNKTRVDSSSVKVRSVEAGAKAKSESLVKSKTTDGTKKPEGGSLAKCKPPNENKSRSEPPENRTKSKSSGSSRARESSSPSDLKKKKDKSSTD